MRSRFSVRAHVPPEATLCAREAPLHATESVCRRKRYIPTNSLRVDCLTTWLPSCCLTRVERQLIEENLTEWLQAPLFPVERIESFCRFCWPSFGEIEQLSGFCATSLRSPPWANTRNFCTNSVTWAAHGELERQHSQWRLRNTLHGHERRRLALIATGAAGGRSPFVGRQSVYANSAAEPQQVPPSPPPPSENMI